MSTRDTSRHFNPITDQVTSWVSIGLLLFVVSIGALSFSAAHSRALIASNAEVSDQVIHHHGTSDAKHCHHGGASDIECSSNAVLTLDIAYVNGVISGVAPRNGHVGHGTAATPANPPPISLT